MACGQLHDSAAQLVIRLGTNKTVAGTDETFNSCSPASPSHCTGVGRRAVIPRISYKDIVAISEFCDSSIATADLVICRAAYETIAGTDHTFYAKRSASPCQRPCVRCCTVVPTWTANDVIAIRERRNSPCADFVVRLASNETVAGTDGPFYSRGPISPCHRTGVGRRTVVPCINCDHIVAVSEFLDETPKAAADLVIGRAAYKTIAGTDASCYAKRSTSPSDRAGVGRRAVVPARTSDEVVSVREGCDC